MENEYKKHYYGMQHRSMDLTKSEILSHTDDDHESENMEYNGAEDPASSDPRLTLNARNETQTTRG